MSQDLFSSSGDGNVAESSKSTFPSDIVISRPPTLASKCPIESESKRLPVIDAAPKKSSKVQSYTSSDSLEFWLKPGISLPRLHSKDVLQERIEKSESISASAYQSLPPVEKVESLKSESFFSVKSLKSKSDTTTVPDSVVGPSMCKFVFRVPSSEFDLSKCQVKDEPVEEFHALKNWRLWNKEHKKQETYLSKKLKKKPQELLIQQTETFRKHLENKILLGMWNYPVADKWRGHPSDWAIPIEARSKKKILRRRTPSPKYFLEKTPMQKGTIPDLEFIITPTLIKMEKYIRSSPFDYHLIKPNLRISDALATAEERIKSLLKARNRLRPPSDIINALAVVGDKISKKPEVKHPEPIVVSNLPLFEVTPPDHNVSYQDYRKSVFCLIINGKEITYEIDSNSSQNQEATSYDFVWEFAFGLNKIGRRLKKVLKIENRGTIAVRYDWIAKTINRSQYLNKVMRTGHQPCFFFDKNSGIFLPGQFYKFDFYFHAEASGARTETWYMKTTPSFGKYVEFVTIILSGVASDESTELKSDILETYLRERLRDSIVRFVLNCLFERVLNKTEGLNELEYQSMFFEKQLFQYHNPNYYYHSELVEELNTLFENITSESEYNWDFSLDTLTTLISTSPKLRHRGLVLQRVSAIAKKLLKPNYVFSREEKKYRLAYNILCKMVNFMEEDYTYLRKILSHKSPHSLHKLHSWEWEEFEDTNSEAEEKEEWDRGSIFEIEPINLIFFQSMFYIKVYSRVREALENIADMLETRKRFEGSEGINYKKTKPSRRERQSEFPLLF